ncbi:hypothetical protein BH10BAC5_BH10BAC5_15130 [soil metagenome]
MITNISEPGISQLLNEDISLSYEKCITTFTIIAIVTRYPITVVFLNPFYFFIGS